MNPNSPLRVWCLPIPKRTISILQDGPKVRSSGPVQGQGDVVHTVKMWPCLLPLLQWLRTTHWLTVLRMLFVGGVAVGAVIR